MVPAAISMILSVAGEVLFSPISVVLGVLWTYDLVYVFVNIIR